MQSESKDASELAELCAKLGGRVPVSVHFLDNSSKTFLCEVTETFDNLREKIGAKLGLGDGTHMMPFGVFECCDDVIGACCAQNDSPAALILSWGDENLKTEQRKLVFMIRLFLPSLINSKSDVVIHLRYVQAVFEVITGALPVNLEHAIRLAAIQLSVAMPHLNSAGGAPPPGFLGERVVEFVPCDMLMQRRTDQWEQTILGRTWDLKDWSARNLKIRYLELCQQSGRYGFKTFWSRQTKFPQLPEDVLVAAGPGGIRIWTEYDDQPSMDFEFSELSRWGYDPGLLFYVEVNHSLKGGPLCAFQMNNGDQLAEILQDYAMAMLGEADLEALGDAYQNDEPLPPEEDPGSIMNGNSVLSHSPPPPPPPPQKPPKPSNAEHLDAQRAAEAQAEAHAQVQAEADVRAHEEAQARAEAQAEADRLAEEEEKAKAQAAAEAAASAPPANEIPVADFAFTEKEFEAAIFVQRHFRGYLVRLDLYKLELEFAATHIQSIARGFLHRNAINQAPPPPPNKPPPPPPSS